MIWRFLLISLFVFFSAVAPAFAQSFETEELGSTWFAGDGKFGMLFLVGDFHPYFVNGVCDAAKRRATVQFDMDTKLYVEALTTNKHIFIRANNGEAQKDLNIARLEMSEAAKYPWLLTTEVSMDTLLFWARGPQLILSLELGNYQETTTGKKFVLANQNRSAALTSFVRDCFGYQPTHKP